MDDTQRELFLFVSHTQRIWRHVEDCFRNLERKQRRGNYDSTLAVKLMTYPAVTAAKEYCQEFGGTWHSMFSVADRLAVATELRDYFENERACGNSWLTE